MAVAKGCAPACERLLVQWARRVEVAQRVVHRAEAADGDERVRVGGAHSGSRVQLLLVLLRSLPALPLSSDVDWV